MTNNYINKIFFSIAIFCMLNSCQKQLELVPLSEISDAEYYNTPEEVESAVIAIYDGLQEIPMSEFAVTEMRSDNTQTKSSEGSWAQFERFEIEPTNLAVGEYWSANYNVIFRANVVLANLEVVTDKRRGQFEGEARFARALAHFNLVRAYGDVPIVDRVIIQTDTDYFDRDPVSAVLDVIDADFTAASNLLESFTPDNYYRATSGAAKAMLAKVKLTAKDYAGAKELCEEIINSGTYDLEANYSDIFYNEGNTEVMFAIGYINDNENESQQFSIDMTNLGRAQGLNYITNDFTNFMNQFYSNDSERFEVLYNEYDLRQVGKYLHNAADNSLAGNDWIVIRFADVLLMHAESIMAGSTISYSNAALTSFNKVRSRVDIDEVSELSLQMLSNERRIELAFENHRLYDMIRMGFALGQQPGTLQFFGTQLGYSFEPTDLLLPIPQGEINVSDGLLIQNGGY